MMFLSGAPRACLRSIFVRLAIIDFFLVACGGSDELVAPAPTTVTTATTTATAATTATTTAADVPAGSGAGYSPVALDDGGRVLVRQTAGTVVFVVDPVSNHRWTMPEVDATYVNAIGLNRAGLVAGTIANGVGACPADTTQECPTESAFVWDSDGGTITRLDGFRAMAGPNSAGLVVVFRDPDGAMLSSGVEELSVWDSTTGARVPLEQPGLGHSMSAGNGLTLSDSNLILGLTHATVAGTPEIAVWNGLTGSADVLDPPVAPVPPGVWWRPIGIDDHGHAVVCDALFSGCSVWEPTTRTWSLLVDDTGNAGATPELGGVTVDTVDGRGIAVGHSWGPSPPGTSPGEYSPPDEYRVEVWDLVAGGASTSIGLGALRFAMPTAVNSAGQILAAVDVENDALGVPYLYEPSTDTWAPVVH